MNIYLFSIKIISINFHHILNTEELCDNPPAYFGMRGMINPFLLTLFESVSVSKS
jgi:hypothetical protein